MTEMGERDRKLYKALVQEADKAMEKGMLTEGARQYLLDEASSMLFGYCDYDGARIDAPHAHYIKVAGMLAATRSLTWCADQMYWDTRKEPT